MKSMYWLSFLQGSRRRSSSEPPCSLSVFRTNFANFECSFMQRARVSCARFTLPKKALYTFIFGSCEQQSAFERGDGDNMIVEETYNVLHDLAHWRREVIVGFSQREKKFLVKCQKRVDFPENLAAIGLCNEILATNWALIHLCYRQRLLTNRCGE